MLTQEFAQHFAQEWIAAWNAHDLPRILSHYADDFEMTSPFIAKVSGESSGRLRGKAAVGAYWQKALTQMPDLHFQLIDVCFSVDTLCLRYQSVLDLQAVEWLCFGADGKVIQAIAHYNRLPR